MNLNKVTRTLGKVGLNTKKYSPEILLIMGGSGIITAFCWAISKFEKAHDVNMNKKEKLQIIYNASATEELSKLDMDEVKGVKVEYAAGMMKVYAGPVIVGILSLGAITTSFGILKGRNVMLGIALGAVQEKFNEYRSRVKSKYGDEEERRILTNEREIELSFDDGEGKVTKEKVLLREDLSDFSKVFDETCPSYTKDSETNRLVIMGAENYFNQRLRAIGHVFLNEVYDEFGFNRTKNGAIFGWIYNEDSPEGHIDFGITRLNDYKNGASKKADFINGFERAVWIDFNVDGIIYDLI